MTDPFSVAVGVAGLISLGIQVTQPLVDFYASYKNQDSNIASTTKKLKSLLDIFQHLHKALASRKFNADERGLIEKIENAIRDCDESIKDLQEECQKLSKTSARGAKDFVRVGLRRVAYPLRLSTLQKLEESIGDLRTKVSFALAALQLKDSTRFQHNIDDTNALLELVRASQISADIRDWIKAPDVSINHNSACVKRHPGTGMWLVKSDIYITWLTKSNSLLWLNGFAGSGKSVLCSTVIQFVFRHRRSDPCIGIAFFYFAFNDESKQDESAMLRAWLLQLSIQLQDEYKDLANLRNSYPTGTPPSPVLLDYLRRLIARFDHVYLILDALDESPRNGLREKVLDALDEIRGWGLQGVHLFTTSRDELDIRESVSPSSDQEVAMRNAGIEEDIASFIYSRLTKDRRLARWWPFRDKIQEALAKGAQGVFRWVECQFKSLQSCPRSEYHLEHLLKSLPQSLDETYERMLCNIDSYSIDEARQILTLLCFAARPLKVHELLDGIAVELKDAVGFNRNRRLQDASDIQGICPGLIEITFDALTMTDNSDADFDVYSVVDSDVDSDGVSDKKFTQTVRIAHFSVQEYLESERIQRQKAAIFSLSSATAHAEIAQICLLYLLEPDLSRTLQCKTVRKEYPLAKFAAEYWYHHYQRAECRVKIDGIISSLFRRQDPFATWVRMHDIERWKPNIDFHRALDDIASPVYYASLLGLDHVLHDIINIEQLGNPTLFDTLQACRLSVIKTVNASGGDYGNALQAASRKGHESVVQLLLENGADVNAQGGEYGNALQAALTYGHESVVQHSVVQLLLENGADVNAQGGYYGNVLQAASTYGHESVVQLLLKNGANVNAQGGEHGNALQAASTYGHESVVQLLLKNGADVDAQGGKYGNALQAASRKGHESVVQLLLENGANVNAQGEVYGNALQAASSNGHESVVQLLLENGADINAQDGYFGSALQAASFNGHESVVQLLLQHIVFEELSPHRQPTCPVLCRRHSAPDLEPL